MRSSLLSAIERRFSASKEGPVLPLVPHESEPAFEPLDDPRVPTILMTTRAWSDTKIISEASGNEEVGWLGTVEEREGGVYVIDRLFLFHQEVGPAHCRFDALDIGKFYSEMRRRSPETRDLVNSIAFWGHLHPGEMVEPSSQDDLVMSVFDHNPFFIRGIFTRVGKCRFTFFDYRRGLKIVDCPWALDLGADDARRREIAAEMKAKIRRPAPKRSSSCPKRSTSIIGASSTSSRRASSRPRSR